jgi:hypothetical protein
MKSSLCAILAVVLMTAVCQGQIMKQKNPNTVCYFNGNKYDTRSYFTLNDTLLTFQVRDIPDSRTALSQIDQVELRVYHKKKGRALSVPVVSLTSGKRKERQPSVSISLRGKIDASVESIVLNVSAVYWWDQGLKRRAGLGRGELYRQFILAGE